MLSIDGDDDMMMMIITMDQGVEVWAVFVFVGYLLMILLLEVKELS